MRVRYVLRAAFRHPAKRFRYFQQILSLSRTQLPARWKTLRMASDFNADARARLRYSHVDRTNRAGYALNACCELMAVGRRH